jgi:hypothetical protein
MSSPNKTAGAPGNGRATICAEASRELEFFLPRLYPLVPEAGDKSYHSRVGNEAIFVVVPAVIPNKVRGVAQTWIVPRVIKLIVPAGLAETLTRSDVPVVSWWTRVCDWLAAWGGQPAGVDRAIQRRVRAPSDSIEPPLGTMKLYALPGWTRASTAEFTQALELAGRGVDTPTEYRLLALAQEHRESGDLRGCVIDAAGAAETALVSALDRRASGARAKRRGGLTELYGSAVDLGLSPGIERPVLSQFAVARNRAVHVGYGPTTHEADLAVQAAKALVRSLSGRATPPMASLPAHPAGR